MARTVLWLTIVAASATCFAVGVYALPWFLLAGASLPVVGLAFFGTLIAGWAGLTTERSLATRFGCVAAMTFVLVSCRGLEFYISATSSSGPDDWTTFFGLLAVLGGILIAFYGGLMVGLLALRALTTGSRAESYRDDR